MHETKCKLIEKNGLRCMYCGEEVPYNQINWHHIKPKYISKMYGELPDDSYENGALVCLNCHSKIHQYAWWDEEYHQMMKVIEGNTAP